MVVTKMVGDEPRDYVFDTLKGVGILLVIVGHSDVGPFNAFLGSFLMPLFFFITGFFLKKRSVAREIYISVKRLLVPYAFTAICICTACAIFNLITCSNLPQTEIIVRFLLGFYGKIFPEWIAGTIGVLWFVLALFWARIFVSTSLLITAKFVPCNESLRNVLLCLLCICFATLGIVFENNFFIPFCIPQGLTATGFVYAGYIIKKFDVFNGNGIKLFFPFLAVLWFYSWSQGGMHVANSDYPIGYVFGLLGAVGGFVTFFYVVKQLYSANSWIWRVLLFSGRYSLIIYCVHSVDPPNSVWRAFAYQLGIPCECFDLFQISVRLIIAFLFTCLILKITLIRRCVFQIK